MGVENDLTHPLLQIPGYATVGDTASIRKLALRPVRLLTSFVPLFPVYVNFILHVNYERLYPLG